MLEKVRKVIGMPMLCLIVFVGAFMAPKIIHDTYITIFTVQ